MSASWSPMALGAVALWSSGATPSKSRSDYWAGDMPWVSPKDMKRFSLDDAEDHISEVAISDGARIAPAGTVFIVVRGMILAHTFPVCIAERTMAFNQDVKALVPQPGVDGRFLAHWLHGNRSKLLGLVTEATHGTKRIDLRDLQAAELMLPSTPEQRRIAEILDTLDEAIRKTEQLIAKLKQVKQGLLHDLLTRGIDDNGELRDPVRHPEQFKDSALGRLPRGWSVLRMRDLYAEPARNGLYKPPAFHGRGPHMVQMGNIFRGLAVSFAGAGRVAVTPAELATYALREGDLLFGRRSLVMEGAGKCALVERLNEPATFESSIVRVRVKPDRVSPLFVAHFLTGDAGYRDRRRFIRQVAVSGVSGGDISQFVVAVPPRAEQARICASIVALDNRISTETIEVRKQEALKHGLMDDLLTGRVRTTALLSDGAAA